MGAKLVGDKASLFTSSRAGEAAGTMAEKVDSIKHKAERAHAEPGLL